MFTLPKLPYSYDALEPYIDARTMEIHHTKHHQAYVDKLNAALEKYPELQNKKVEELLADLNSLPKEIQTAVRNHGGGHYNHSFFWKILTPTTHPLTPSLIKKGELERAINKSFGSFENFKKEFTEKALFVFGSGWCWLVFSPLDKGETKEGVLKIITTSNQDCLLSENKIPILGLDVWEHAYYLKYQNRRAEYIDAFWNIINWEQVEKNLLGSKS